MTKRELKTVEGWKTGSVDLNPNDADFDENLVSGLNSARVNYLRTLGYTIDSWDAYAWAEINELGGKRA